MYDELKSARENERRLGQLLMDREIIIAHDLEFALEHQKYSNEPLGQILVRMGALDEGDLDKVLIVKKRNFSS